MNIVWLLVPGAGFHSGWLAFGIWIITIAGAIVFGLVVLLAVFADKALSPVNKKISGFVVPFLLMILIFFSLIIFMGTVTELM